MVYAPHLPCPRRGPAAKWLPNKRSLALVTSNSGTANSGTTNNSTPPSMANRIYRTASNLPPTHRPLTNPLAATAIPHSVKRQPKQPKQKSNTTSRYQPSTGKLPAIRWFFQRPLRHTHRRPKSNPPSAHWPTARSWPGEQIPLPIPISSALLENLAQQLGTAEVQILEKEAKQIGTRIANMLDGYTVAPAPATGQDPEQWVQPLTTAIAQNEAATPGTPKQQIELQYFSAGRNQTTRRVVEPYWLEERHDIKYLRAYCHTAEDVRLFRLDRILACETVEQ